MNVKIIELIEEICQSIKIFLSKANSRKFLVWAIGTHMTYIHLLDPDHWMVLSLLYIGVQYSLDMKKNIPAIQGPEPSQFPARPVQ